MLGRSFGAKNAFTPFNAVKVNFQNALLVQQTFQQQRQKQARPFFPLFYEPRLPSLTLLAITQRRLELLCLGFAALHKLIQKILELSLPYQNPLFVQACNYLLLCCQQI